MAAYVQAVNCLTVTSGPLPQYASQTTFAEYYSSSFPVFALGAQVSGFDLQEVAEAVNKQAQAELRVEDSELAELAYVVAIPTRWQLYEKSTPDAIQWYREEFNKHGTGDTDNPQWYALASLVSCLETGERDRSGVSVL